MDQQPIPRHGSRLAGFLAVLVVAGSGLGVLVYQALQNRERPPMDATGFNLASAPGTSTARAPAAPAAQAPQESGLGMVKTGMPGVQFGGKAVAAAPQDPGARLTSLVRGSEDKTRALYFAFKDKYPVLRQYSQDWQSYPDLKKLHEDYRKDHDPIAFMKGLVRSKNFGSLLKKYATEPAVRELAKAELQAAPEGVIAAATDFLKDDANMKALADQVGQALGLPPGLLGGGSDQKVDQKAVLDSVMQSHPELQKAAESQGR